MIDLISLNKLVIFEIDDEEVELGRSFDQNGDLSFVMKELGVTNVYIFYTIVKVSNDRLEHGRRIGRLSNVVFVED